MGRVLLTVGGALLVCLALAAFFGLLPGSYPANGKPRPGLGPAHKKVDLGGPLYAPAAVKPIEPQAPQKGDTTILAGQLNTPEQSEHASQVDGQISFIGEELPEWLPVVTGVAPLLAEPMSFRRFSVARVEKKAAGMSESSQTGDYQLVQHELVKFYRRLKESDPIRADQVLTLIDPTQILSQVELQRTKVLIAVAEAVAARKKADEAAQRLEISRMLFNKRPPAIAAEDFRLAELTYANSYQEWVVKKESIRAALMEESQAVGKLKVHTVLNKMNAQQGVIKKVLRQPGDAVKAQEPILQIVATDPLEADALVEVQLANKLNKKRRVIVEPTEEIPPRHTFKAHTLEITGVAVSNQPNQPFIVSGSEDRTVCVWLPGVEAPIDVLSHPAPVRSLVCSPRGAKHNYCLVGCDDGSLHLWDLSAAKPPFPRLHMVPGGAHKDSSVTAVAFSPDGDWFASGGSDSRIFIWDTGKIADKQRKTEQWYEYAVESDTGDLPHEGTITRLTLLPQAKLVSASRDRTLRVWCLFQKGARLAYDPLAHRSGIVPQVGASQDGRWLLFDQAKSLQLRSVETGQMVKTLQNPAGTIPFETLAVFSPDASLLLTAGAPEGRLQLWKAPTENSRGFEVRQLTTVERQPVTCAAFAPAADHTGAGFAVSGTKDGNVYYWALPTQAEIDNHRIEDAQISVIAEVLDQARQVPIRIALRNPDGRLKPGRPVTIVIEP